MDFLPKLAKFNLRAIDLYITDIPDKYSYDFEHGGIQIPFNYTLDGLVKFLNQEKLRDLRNYQVDRVEMDAELNSIKESNKIHDLRLHANFFPGSLRKQIEGVKQLSLTLLMVGYILKKPSPSTVVFITSVESHTTLMIL